MNELIAQLVFVLGCLILGLPFLKKILDANKVNLASVNFWLLGAILFIIYLLIALKNYLKKWAQKHNYDHKTIFCIRLPKEKPKDQDKDTSVQQLHEEIAKGETIFATIGGLKPESGFKAWLFGRHDHFGFEIVAHKSRISFYVAAPDDKARYIEQQIHAYYPEASIEEINDYNAFDPTNFIAGGYLKTKKEFIFPLKTYTKMETDPMNGIINVMSKLEKDESISIQFLARGAGNAWRARIKSVVGKAYQANSVKDALKKEGPLSFLGGALKSPEKKDPNNPALAKRLTAMEEEMLKAMEAKSSRAGLQVNLRIIVSTKEKERTSLYLDNIANSFSEYNNYDYGNNFTALVKTQEAVTDFIHRRFNDKLAFLLNTEELTSLFHLPLRFTETPNIDWLTSKTAPAPNNIPNEGIVLGYNVFRGERRDIRIKRVDRRRHSYIIGKSGTGKSVLLSNMAIQDIQNGEGVCVMEPNGDLIEDILNRIPPERAEDVIVFAPADLERPIGLNLLEYDSRYPEQKSFVINEMIGIFDKLYDLKATGGPMFEQYMRNALLLIMDDPETGSTLMEVPKVLSDEQFRRMKLSRCKNMTVVDFWRKEAEKAGGDAALANIVPYITSKLTPFIANDMMRPIIGQQKSAFNMRDIMDNKKIILVDLPKGAIGETNAYLLGMIIVGKILMAALSRTDIPQEQRKDFYLYIDEFQNFTTNSICQILSEARKYGLSLNIAHQYLGQLVKNNDTQIKDAIFGNVGTMISFKVGVEDAQFLVKDFGPVFNEYDLVNVGRGGFIKLLVDGATTRPFSFQTVWPLLGDYRQDFSKKIRTLSRYKFGQDRQIVDTEILRRANII
jgi:hypothetical protein